MEITLIVEGMTCGGCEKSVRNAVMQAQGVADVQIDRLKNQARIAFTPSYSDKDLQAEAIKQAIANVEAAGFDCRPA
jgi:copper chaperone